MKALSLFAFFATIAFARHGQLRSVHKEVAAAVQTYTETDCMDQQCSQECQSYSSSLAVCQKVPNANVYRLSMCSSTNLVIYQFSNSNCMGAGEISYLPLNVCSMYGSDIYVQYVCPSAPEPSNEVFSILTCTNYCEGICQLQTAPTNSCSQNSQGSSLTTCTASAVTQLQFTTPNCSGNSTSTVISNQCSNNFNETWTKYTCGYTPN